VNPKSPATFSILASGGTMSSSAGSKRTTVLLSCAVALNETASVTSEQHASSNDR